MNILIKNGTIFDPETQRMFRGDVAVKGTVLAAPDPAEKYRAVVDAEGCIVCPGFIDYHMHCFNHGTENGVSPDGSTLPCGVTTCVDGGSGGAGTWEMMQHAADAVSQVRILSMLHIATGGQPCDGYPESINPKYFDEDKVLRLFERFPMRLVGIKTRISDYTAAPEDAVETLKKTVEIAGKAGTRVIVHVTRCSIPLDELASHLRPGDVICHIYHGRGPNTCLGPDGKVLPGLFEARKRGVIFDSCNGMGNYDLNVAGAAISQGFTPDVISSDMNSSSAFCLPLHSLPRVMSKYLDMGMTLEQVLSCVTSAPAALIGRGELASMAEGTPADLTVFKLVKKAVKYTDMGGHTFDGTQVIVPQMTVRDGAIAYCQADFG